MRSEPRPRYPLAIGLIIVLGAYLLWQTITGAAAARSAHEAALIFLGGSSVTIGLAAFGSLALIRSHLRQRHLAEIQTASRYGDVSKLPTAPLYQSQTPARSTQLVRSSNLPLVLLLRPNWWRILGSTGLVILLVEWLGGSLMLLMGDSLHDALLYPIAATVIFAPAFFLLAVNEARQTVEMSKYKLLVMGSARRTARTIHFSEARLFAIRPPGKRGTSPICYELASPSIAVRLVRVQRRMPFMPWLFVSNTQPTIPWDQYEVQMEWLLSYVAEQTRLPLYDLR